MMRIFHTFALRLILTTAVLIGVISTATTLIMSQQYSSALMRQTEGTTLSAFSIAAGQIEKQLADARNVSVHATQTSEVLAFLRNDFSTTFEYIQARRSMIETLRDYFVRYDYLNGLMLLSPDGVLLGATPHFTFTWFEPTPLATALVAQMERDRTPGIVWLGTYRMRDFYAPIGEGVAALLLEEPMICALEPRTFSYSDGRQTLYVLISITQASLDAAISHLDDADSAVSLLDPSGNLITGGQALDPALLDTGTMAGSIRATVGGERVQLIYTRLPSTGWVLAKCVPLAVYNSLTDSLRRASLLTALCTLAVAVALYSVWAARFMRPLKAITQVLRAIEDGGGDRMRIHSGVLEFDFIAERFNAMMDSMDAMHQRQIQGQRELLVLEIRNLQSQINPHFIYNSITSIRWLATLLGVDKVSSMLIELAEILKPIFSEWRLEWQIKDELAFTEHYMKLMQLRYGAGFVVSRQFPDALLDSYVPRFILQPLLENACEHGKDEDGQIEVDLSATLEGGDAVLHIQDNGLGMDAETLRRVHETLGGSRQPGNGRTQIGLRNVHQRVQLYYGPSYGLTVDSEPGAGVRIDVRIRVVRQPSGLAEEA